ncbi:MULTISPECIES: BT1926 family outer membrane beta-barrel protein [unclassified Porphyromonas]|uniref:BT1926 family outer membrane beta-barrel protein n=1 Tax=unclassified Porphyromonas TaxID=2645799 RepID=UPI00126A6D6C|nr:MULTISPECIES: BT1926 family outer membrane beta-barrel protein [unclassified Porphyromonas]
MRRLLTSLLALCALGVASAQNYKADQGMVSTEVSLFASGLTSNPLDLTQGALKGRVFLGETLALRMGLNLSNVTTSATKEDNQIVQNHIVKATSSTYTNKLLIGVGVEKHFAGTKRLSPYVAADLNWGLGFTQKETQTNIKSVEDEVIKSPMEHSLGGAVMLGADYYVAKQVFIGLETGLRAMGGWKTKGSVRRGNTIQQGSTTSSSFDLKPTLHAGFRLGFVF